MVPNMRPDDCHRPVVWKQDVFRFPRAYTYFYYGKYLSLYILSQTTTKEIEVFSIQSTCWFTRSRTSVTLQVVRPPSVLFPFFYHSAPRASRPTSQSLDIPIRPYTAPGHVWCGSSSFAPSNTYWPPPIYPHPTFLTLSLFQNVSLRFHLVTLYRNAHADQRFFTSRLLSSYSSLPDQHALWYEWQWRCSHLSRWL